MRSLSSIAILILLALNLAAQSPHGEDLKISCGDCHTSEGWKVDKNTIAFNHNSTGFALEGQHNQLNCRLCHSSLVFSRARPECMYCHTDVHEQTLGFECNRCHTPKSWLVEDITSIHQMSRFPLVGPHTTALCFDCHPSASLLRFESLGVECYDCHKADYEAATKPNHMLAGFSTDCSECHMVNAFAWTGPNFNHSFFPLTEGHAIEDCQACHKDGDYTNTSPDCYSCHEADFISAEVPNHLGAGFSINCNECHTTNPGWSPAEFRQHDGLHFPIYSGTHAGEWNSCNECHSNPQDYTVNSCTVCHEHNQGDMDEEHQGVGGYIYQDDACLACHPTGTADGTFDHNLTIFPLTGAHTTTDCLSCHSQGYTGTTTVCSDCHMEAFNQSQNPSHQEIGIPTDCGSCHTTDPGWVPATFPIHNEIYPLLGAHAAIATNCAECHQGDYNNTPNTCFGCHEEEFNQATDPNHVTAQFSTDCQLCHNESAWEPSTFNHDGQYFPIYSGKHQGEWNNCMDCHTNASNYAIFSCIDCHEHEQSATDEEHQGVGGYMYTSEACFACHPTGEATGGFNHNNTSFPLTGAHLTTACIDCHASGYTGTTTVCSECHDDDYMQSQNPNHFALNIPNTCDQCHTTNPGWEPAAFPIHNSYYELQGAHLIISSDCAACHGGNYNSTPNTCFGCHDDQYNQTVDPPHLSLQFSTDCELCHTQNAWEPSTFNHDGQYFPIYSGEHQGEWETCSDCHTNPGNYAIFSCIDCHEHNQPDMDDEHEGVPGYSYNSQACLGCHPTGQGGGFNHNSTNFPLTGAHATTACLECHESGYIGTTTICAECHFDDYNQSTNPNHLAIGIPNTCEDCHTTNPGWAPATFPIHNAYYPLTGAHLNISLNCDICHNGNFNTTPSTCFGCHQTAYNQTSNPNHLAIGIPNTCEDCHTTNPGWAPAGFPIHNNYWVIQGAHLLIADDCDECHNGNYVTTPNTCFGCHETTYNQTTNPAHASAQFPTDCELCHTQSAWVPSTFNHDGQYFPIYSGEHEGEWDLCSDCHIDPNNYAVFSCLGCHPQGEMDDEHEDVPGYSYNSNACYNCHPTGSSMSKNSIRRIQ